MCACQCNYCHFYNDIDGTPLVVCLSYNIILMTMSSLEMFCRNDQDHNMNKIWLNDQKYMGCRHVVHIGGHVVHIGDHVVHIGGHVMH